MRLSGKTLNIVACGLVASSMAAGALVAEARPSLMTLLMSTRPLTPEEERLAARAASTMGNDRVQVLGLQDYRPDVDAEVFHSPMLCGSSILVLPGNSVWRRYESDEQSWLLSVNLAHASLNHGLKMYAWMAASFCIPFFAMFRRFPNTVLTSIASLAIHYATMLLVEKRQYKEAALRVLQLSENSDEVLSAGFRQLERERRMVGFSVFNTPTADAREKILSAM